MNLQLQLIKRLLLITITTCGVVAKAQIGINTDSPTNTLDVNGMMRVRSLEKATPYKSEKILVVDSLGVVQASESSDIAPSPDKVGGVISDGEKLIVAQEMVSLVSRDFVTSVRNTPQVINTVNKKIVDSDGTFNDGVFRVTTKGIYQIIINAHVTSTTRTSDPVLGLWNGTTNNWIARVGDTYASRNDANSFQMYTMVALEELSPGIDYSFRIALEGTNGRVTVKAVSTGLTGTGDASYFSVKRIK